MANQTQNKVYECTKCNHTDYRTEEIRATGSGFSRFLNIQNKRFTGVICAQCGYTEFYSSGRSGLGANILDMFTG
jgi:predicted nucleic-acid-binding Zn-ribbon protein|tara:strand:+ start:325 stop:549 length:225 start_codon:yes stop_codon:yes gene_type:complete